MEEACFIVQTLSVLNVFSWHFCSLRSIKKWCTDGVAAKLKSLSQKIRGRNWLNSFVRVYFYPVSLLFLCKLGINPA